MASPLSHRTTITMPQAPDIHSYYDYREFLRDTVAWRKAHDGRLGGDKFSLRRLKVAKPDGGFYSVQFLSLVLTGKKDLPLAAVPAVGSALGLPERDWVVLERLVRLSTTEDAAERAKFIRQLSRRGAYREGTGLGSRERLEFLSHGMIGDVYLLTARPTCLAAPAWIKSELVQPVGEPEVRYAIEVLTKLGLVRVEGEGETARLVRTEAPRPYPKYGEAELFLLYHAEQIEKARRALERLPMEDRHFTTWGVSRFTPQRYREFQLELKKRVEQVLAQTVAEFESRESEATVVAQVNLNVFPVSRLPGEGGT